MKEKKITGLRKNIDIIDEQIVDLVNQRAEITSEIGRIKKKKEQPAYRPERERKVYERALKNNKGPLSEDCVKAVYREIMSGCLALEDDINVAYLGPELTFTHQAALKKFGASLRYTPCDSISEIFREVEKGNADYGVVPIENSTEGAVNHTLDMFVDSSLLICSEIYLDIKQNLLSASGKISAVKRIYSHPNVFGQCRGWIEKKLPKARLCEVASTAKAAGQASSRTDSACIASDLAAEHYDLKVIARSIQDSPVNITRFLVIGRRAVGVSGEDKTSIMFTVKDTPGILYELLGAFKKRGINLTKIESRPLKRDLWKYYFFVDMEGHITTPRVKSAIEEIKKKADLVKMMGSYPSAIHAR